MAEEALRILQLRVNNVMAIRAVELDLEGKPVVTITGDNAQGKSSLLLAIAMALGGKRHVVEQALRQGEKKGEIFIDLGAYKIRRRITEKSTYLTVYDADGNEVTAPQLFLDERIGPFFEPLAPIRKSPREQAELLRKIAGVDVADLDKERADVFERRRGANSDAKRAKAHAASLPTYGDAPDERVDLGELVAELDAVRAHNARNEDLRREADAAESALDRAQKRHADLKLQLLEAERAMKEAHEANSQAQAQLVDIEDRDEAPIRQQMQDAGELNRKVEANRAAGRALEQAETAEREARGLTQRLDEIDAEKAARLAKSKLGVKGLSFNDDRGYFNGVPLEQASQAQQIKIWCALAFADRPDIRVLFVRDASLLDRKSREQIAKIAAHHKAQFLLEMVESDEPGAIRIEGGLVK